MYYTAVTYIKDYAMRNKLKHPLETFTDIKSPEFCGVAAKVIFLN